MKFHQTLLREIPPPEFSEYVNLQDKDDALFTAYRAMSEAILADYYWNPFEKYNRIKQFESKMNKAIDLDSTDLEIRFLRLSAEFHIPRWLGLSNHLLTDRDYIVACAQTPSNLQFDEKYAHYILYFLAQTELFSENELDQLRIMLDKN